MKHKTLATITILIISVFGSAVVLNQIINQTQPHTTNKYAIEVAFPNLFFDHPAGIYNSGDGTNSLFVVGQLGVIYVFENQRNASEANIFLDIQAQVHLGAFLGLAFDPNFKDNGHFYVNYIADTPLRTIIAQWSVSPNNPNEAKKPAKKSS